MGGPPKNETTHKKGTEVRQIRGGDFLQEERHPNGAMDHRNLELSSSALGPIAAEISRLSHVRSAPNNGLKSDIAASRFRATLRLMHRSKNRLIRSPRRRERPVQRAGRGDC